VAGGAAAADPAAAQGRDRVRLEQERVKYQLVQKVVLSLHR
jgi:hypothetical protein